MAIRTYAPALLRSRAELILSALTANPGGLSRDELTYATFGFDLGRGLDDAIKFARNNLGKRDRVLIYDRSNNVYKLVTAANAVAWQESLRSQAASLVNTAERASGVRGSKR